MSALALVPNLGDEERDPARAGEEDASGRWSRALALPPVATAARLWRLLFPQGARVLVPPEAPEIPWDAWPDALREGCERPALPALEGLGGCVPWIASRGAHEAAHAAGLSVAGPEPAIVHRVHDKAFAVRSAESAGLVPRPLRGLCAVLDPDDLESPERASERIRTAVAGWPAWARARAVLKPRIGTSGRGRLESEGGSFPADALARALPKLRARSGAILEPWLPRARDFSVQLYLEPGGGVVLLGTLELLVSPTGGYLGHRGEVDSRGRVFSGHRHDEALREAGAAVANAAAEAGFHGAAGVDAFTFQLPAEAAPPGAHADGDEDGPRALLRPVVELNARFTMGTVAVGLVRRALPRARQALDLGPGDRRAFWLSPAPPRQGWAAAREAAGPGSLMLPLWPDEEDTGPGLLLAASAEAIDRATRGSG